MPYKDRAKGLEREREQTANRTSYYWRSSPARKERILRLSKARYHRLSRAKKHARFIAATIKHERKEWKKLFSPASDRLIDLIEAGCSVVNSKNITTPPDTFMVYKNTKLKDNWHDPAQAFIDAQEKR